MTVTVPAAAADDAGAISTRLTELVRRPYDLEKGPLFRLHLLSRSASEHIVLLVFHHIIGDFLSSAVFLDDLGVNLKPARSLGMHTIKVTDVAAALRELEGLVGLPLVG